jgi:hypothetical protein
MGQQPLPAFGPNGPLFALTLSKAVVKWTIQPSRIDFLTTAESAEAALLEFLSIAPKFRIKGTRASVLTTIAVVDPDKRRMKIAAEKIGGVFGQNDSPITQFNLRFNRVKPLKIGEKANCNVSIGDGVVQGINKVGVPTANSAIIIQTDINTLTENNAPRFEEADTLGTVYRELLRTDETVISEALELLSERV